MNEYRKERTIFSFIIIFFFYAYLIFLFFYDHQMSVTQCQLLGKPDKF